MNANKELLRRVTGGVGLALALGACAAEGPVDESRSEPAVEQSSAVGLAIEQAERMLDRGGDAAQAVPALQAALGDPAITPAEHRTAVLALSRAHEAAGEQEQAVAVIEKELAAHADDRAWEDEPFKRRLRLLLTGSESTRGIVPERPERVARFAHVVASYFPPDADGAVKATFYVSGGRRDVSDELGTFNIRGALKKQKEEQCPLCDNRVNVSEWTRQSDWLVIPEMQSQFDSAFLVFYFDLGRNRIPARYERHLPMKVADIEAELKQGKSFVLAKERPGAPPVLLLAAPRTAMLEDVERELAMLGELPTELKYFEVRSGLRPLEIQAAVRAHWFPAVRECYEELLERDAQAVGKLVLRFRILGSDGTVDQLQVNVESAGLREDTFVECVEQSAQGMSFPATGTGNTTVSYPVHFSPS
jgi:hypothetical protein